MKHVEKDELKAMFKTSDVVMYQKQGRFLARPAITNEAILTIVAGKLETMKEAQEGEMVLRNIVLGSSAETYIINGEQFKKRYEPEEKVYLLDGFTWNVVHAKGQIHAFEYKGEDIKFVATWGEEMVCHEGDYIANPVGSNEDDIYRIEKDTFYQTYYKM